MAYKIMVVDDETQIRELLNIFLTRKGFNVCHVPDAKSALKMIAEDADVDLVILDNRMPGMMGSEIVDSLKDIQPKIKVILLTGSISAGRNDLNIDAFIRKPVDLNVLLKTIEQTLSAA